MRAEVRRLWPEAVGPSERARSQEAVALQDQPASLDREDRLKVQRCPLDVAERVASHRELDRRLRHGVTEQDSVAQTIEAVAVQLDVGDGSVDDDASL